MLYDMYSVLTKMSLGVGALILIFVFEVIRGVETEKEYSLG